MQKTSNLIPYLNSFSQKVKNNDESDELRKTGLCLKDKKHHDLYQKIVDFPLDNPQAVTPFSVRLAIDNAWNLDYTKQVIKEYKRFLFLLVAAGHKVAPSDQVDQAWHLHITCTHAYWEEFCAKIVDKKLHHWPAEGGNEFHDWYRMTISSYIRFFGHPPPENIWIDPDMRLKTRTWFIRIDKQENWIIAKPKLAEKCKNILECIGLSKK